MLRLAAPKYDWPKCQRLQRLGAPDERAVLPRPRQDSPAEASTKRPRRGPWPDRVPWQRLRPFDATRSGSAHHAPWQRAPLVGHGSVVETTNRYKPIGSRGYGSDQQRPSACAGWSGSPSRATQGKAKQTPGKRVRNVTQTVAQRPREGWQGAWCDENNRGTADREAPSSNRTRLGPANAHGCSAPHITAVS